MSQQFQVNTNISLWPQVRGMLTVQLEEWVRRCPEAFVTGRLMDGSTNSLLQDSIQNDTEYRSEILINAASLEYLNYQNGLGNTALALAVEQKKERLVGLLLEKGAAVDLADIQNRTPLHASIGVGCPITTVTMLLEAGANPFHRDLSDWDVHEHLKMVDALDGVFVKSPPVEELKKLIASYEQKWRLNSSVDNIPAVSSIARHKF